jgi:hypothetical protein
MAKMGAFPRVGALIAAALVCSANLCDARPSSSILLPRLRGECAVIRGQQMMRLRGGESPVKPSDSPKTEAREGEGTVKKTGDEALTVEELVASGRVAMVEQNYSIAADYLSAAVELKVAEEGELAPR